MANFNETQCQWVQQEAARWNISMSEVLRRLVDESSGIPDPMEALAVPREPLAPTVDNLIKAARESFFPPLVVERLAITWEQYSEWIGDPEVAQRFRDAQCGFIAEQQARLVAIGRGEMKGNRQALETFLAAYHPCFGRIKGEIVRREMKPWCDRVLRALRETVGADTEHGRRIIGEFSERLGALQRDATRDFT